jgi:hypothetical protein
VEFQLFPNADCNHATGENATPLYDHTFGSTGHLLTAGIDGKIHVNTATTLDPTDGAAHPNTTAIHKADGAAGGYPNVSWLVTFTPVGDPSHTGSSNTDSNGVCDEQTVLTITDSP